MIGFFDLIEAFRQRTRLAILIAAAVFVVVIVAALLQPRYYGGNASVLIDLANTDPTGDGKGNTDPNVVQGVLGTQVDLMRSSAVLQETARRLNLLNDPSMGETAELRRQNAEKVLQRNLSVNSDEKSNLIRIGFLDRNPNFAAKVVNTVVDTYLDMQVDLRVRPARAGAKWFDARTKEVRQRFEKAQKRLSDFQRAHGIVGIDRMDVEGDTTRTLSVQLAEAKSQMAEAHSRSGAINDPSVVGSDIVQNLQREVGLQEGKFAELSKTYGPNHPDMKAAAAQLGALRSSLSSARANQAQALSSASASASRRIVELEAQLAGQQNRVISMSGVQDQLNVLQRDVDAARQTYDMVRQRFNEATLKSEASQANASRVDQAVPSSFPAKPNLAIWFVAAVMLAGVSALGAVVILELIKPYVRTSSGTSRMADVDVIIDMTNPNWVAPISSRAFKEEMVA